MLWSGEAVKTACAPDTVTVLAADVAVAPPTSVAFAVSE